MSELPSPSEIAGTILQIRRVTTVRWQAMPACSWVITGHLFATNQRRRPTYISFATDRPRHWAVFENESAQAYSLGSSSLANAEVTWHSKTSQRRQQRTRGQTNARTDQREDLSRASRQNVSLSGKAARLQPQAHTRACARTRSSHTAVWLKLWRCRTSVSARSRSVVRQASSPMSRRMAAAATATSGSAHCAAAGVVHSPAGACVSR